MESIRVHFLAWDESVIMYDRHNAAWSRLPQFKNLDIRTFLSNWHHEKTINYEKQESVSIIGTLPKKLPSHRVDDDAVSQ